MTEEKALDVLGLRSTFTFTRVKVMAFNGLQLVHSRCPAVAGLLDGLYNLMAFAVSASSASSAPLHSIRFIRSADIASRPT